MDLSNNDKLKQILGEKLCELLNAVKDNDLNPDTIIRACHELGKVKKSKRVGSVTIAVGKGLEEVMPNGNGGNQNQLGEAMRHAGVGEVDVLRGLYLMANIKRFTGWGQVIYLLQNGRLVGVSQEQRYKVD